MLGSSFDWGQNRDLAERVCQKLNEEGRPTIVATPHWRPSKASEGDGGGSFDELQWVIVPQVLAVRPGGMWREGVRGDPVDRIGFTHLLFQAAPGYIKHR